MMPDHITWDLEADVVVLGSGGAAMTAAIAARNWAICRTHSGCRACSNYRTLGAIDQGPYYAVKMESGALGTAGGPKTNENAQVLDWPGNAIPGLYAAGNAMAAVLGEAYGGAGGTLGPGLTFGYIAGKHLGAHLPNV